MSRFLDFYLLSPSRFLFLESSVFLKTVTVSLTVILPEGDLHHSRDGDFHKFLSKPSLHPLSVRSPRTNWKRVSLPRKFRVTDTHINFDLFQYIHTKGNSRKWHGFDVGWRTLRSPDINEFIKRNVEDFVRSHKKRSRNDTPGPRFRSSLNLKESKMNKQRFSKI